jgi:hypothetical protein
VSHRAARGLALGLLSLHAAAHALFAWDAKAAERPWLVAGWGLALAAALLLAERFESRFASMGEWLERFRAAAVVGFAALTALAPAAVLAAPPLVASVVRFLVGLQAALLLLAAFETFVAAALVNAATLVVFAALGGGIVGAAAVAGWLLWLAPFLVFDRFARTLLAYPRARIPSLAPPLRLALARGGGAALLVLAVFAAFPALPVERDAEAASSVESVGHRAAIVYNLLTLVAMAGTGGVLSLLRLLGRRRRAPPVIDAPETEEMAEEPAPAAERLHQAIPPGERGRIVRAYLRFLEAAEPRVLRRRPSHTPREIARIVAEPAGPLGELTALFTSARWGPDEAGEAEARSAERAAAAIVGALRQRRAIPRLSATTAGAPTKDL